MTHSPNPLAHSGVRLLRLYSYYALLLALSLIVIDGLDKDDLLLGGRAPETFLVVSSVYVFAAAFFAALTSRTTSNQAATAFLFVETALIMTLIYASGGLEAAFGALLLIPVVVGNLLAPGILGYSIAAWISIGLIYSEHVITDDYSLSDTANTGVYGAMAFILAWLTQLLSHRVKDALSLASDNARDVRRLQRLSQQAVMSLPDGLVACDQNHQVLFCNRTAQEWFSLSSGMPLPDSLRTDVNDESKSKSETTGAEANTKHKNNPDVHSDHQAHHPEGRQHRDIGGRKLTLNRMAMPGAEGDYLLLIEDEARISAEAQQIKLASLGRLTASIAHEIRNPLSALQQAAQLLNEADYLTDGDRHLTEVIEHHSQRINRTIVDILKLSRGKQAKSVRLNLQAYLTEFTRQFHQLDSGQDYQVMWHCDPQIHVRFDPDHLTQVLTNLCVNGLRYARKAPHDRPMLVLEARRVGSDQVLLEVRDNGLGVAPNHLPHLFEPFNTTEHDGTGLGLYLCRELCQANLAYIDYRDGDLGACFRLTMQRFQ